MGIVYRARDPRLDREVAIKVLRPVLASDAEARQRLRREALSAAALDHPYLCKIFEIAEDGSALYLAMEFVPGETLQARLERVPMTLPETLRIGAEIAEALEQAHAQGFVHRDLKPANIMLTPQGHAKIMDFGLAKRLANPAPDGDVTVELHAQLTAPGTVVGTPEYMSPEQVMGLPLDARSDQFSFGLILAEMLGGRHPFRQPSVAEIVSAVLRDPPTLSADIPAGLAGVLRRLMAKSADDRYPSMAHARADLAGVAPLPDASPSLAGLARRYTAAWCSHDPAAVAAFFAPDGSLRVNYGEPAIGRAAIAELARGFMTTFPDLEVRMQGLLQQNGRIVYRWSLTGTNSGRPVRIHGFEVWTIGAAGLIAESHGHFDAADYQRQLEGAAAPPRYFDEFDVRARLRMPELIDAMQQALVEFSTGRVRQPVRSVFAFGAERALFGLMPSYVPSLPALGAKLVTVCPSNTVCGLGTHQAIIVMLNPLTGVAEAFVDARYITEARTAAVSAVSARLLARQDSRVLGILGSGVQARSHYEALGLVREFREVRAWSPNADRLRQFGAETGARPMPSAEAVVRGADVVVAATASPAPVVQNEWVAEGAHIIAVGACLPSQRELDPALVARARLVVDSRAAALQEAGDVVMGIAEGRWTADHIAAELGELPVRQNDREITVFKSLGLAVEDLFAAHLVIHA